MSEWGVLAAIVGGGLFLAGRSKKVGQIEQAVKNVGANRANFRENINQILRSQEYAGGFKDKMDRAEALKILGCHMEASEKEVNKAFRYIDS